MIIKIKGRNKKLYNYFRRMIIIENIPHLQHPYNYDNKIEGYTFTFNKKDINKISEIFENTKEKFGM